jgi:hypothetical protein
MDACRNKLKKEMRAVVIGGGGGGGGGAGGGGGGGGCMTSPCRLNNGFIGKLFS